LEVEAVARVAMADAIAVSRFERRLRTNDLGVWVEEVAVLLREILDSTTGGVWADEVLVLVMPC
jgi:hypothetical protein